jgi:hypothetical protein
MADSDIRASVEARDKREKRHNQGQAPRRLSSGDLQSSAPKRNKVQDDDEDIADGVEQGSETPSSTTVRSQPQEKPKKNKGKDLQPATTQSPPGSSQKSKLSPLVRFITFAHNKKIVKIHLLNSICSAGLAVQEQHIRANTPPTKATDALVGNWKDLRDGMGIDFTTFFCHIASRIPSDSPLARLLHNFGAPLDIWNEGTPKTIEPMALFVLCPEASLEAMS